MGLQFLWNAKFRLTVVILYVVLINYDIFQNEKKNDKNSN